MNLKKIFAAPVAAVALAMSSPQQAEATVMRIDFSGIIDSETDAANIIDNSLVGAGRSFSVSYLFDTAIAPVSGTPGVSQRYNGYNWTLNFGNLMGTANTGNVVFRNGANDIGDFGFNETTAGITQTWPLLAPGVEVDSFQALFRGPASIWNTTDANTIFFNDLLNGTTTRTTSLSMSDLFGNTARFDGTINNYSMTDVTDATPVPEPLHTGLALAGGITALAMYHRRKERQAAASTAAPTPDTLA